MIYAGTKLEPSLRTEDWDLQAALKHNNTGLVYEDVYHIHANVPGEADGPDWHWIVEMKNHTFWLVEGGCDYTGWD
jgi:hypothetical protein